MLRLAVSNIRREGDYEVGLCVTFYVFDQFRPTLLLLICFCYFTLQNPAWVQSID